ncbi:MAG TPA: hypothetical protein PKY95_11770 [candidate division Zixibacteria bacterium]|nr:hypothetical protein [candidate division Zixibacteria bacterium]
MSTTTATEIQSLKFALLEAESRLHKARQAVTNADVDILVLRERLRLAEPAGVGSAEAAPRRVARPDLFALKIDLTTEDRVAAARVLRRLAADIEDGDATGWSVSGIEGSAVATPYVPIFTPDTVAPKS